MLPLRKTLLLEKTNPEYLPSIANSVATCWKGKTAITKTYTWITHFKMKSLMQRSQRMIRNGKQVDGSPKMATSYFCKLCGKEGIAHHIRDHVEFNHFEGISIPCDLCGMVFRTRNYLKRHKNRAHKEN